MARRRRSLLDPHGTGGLGASTDEAFDEDGGEEDEFTAPPPGALGSPAAGSRATAGPQLVAPVRRPPAGLEPPYQPTNAPVDAPVAQELFGDGDYSALDGLAPPAEDAPAQVMEDVGQPYTMPFSVPDPPPIPGIVDRFTPPPAQRTDIGSRRKKPDYLAETPAARERYQPTPAPLSRKPPRTDNPISPPPSASAAPPGTPRSMIWIGVASLLFAIVGLASFVGASVLVIVRPGAEDSEAREVVTDGIEPREDVHPDIQPETDGAPNLPPDDEPSNGQPAPVPAEPQGQTQPAQPRPSKAKAEQPEPTGPQIQIRSNRRILVYLDGAFKEYGPTTLSVEPGTYRVRAMVPGQPKLFQEKTVPVAANATVIPIEFTF